MSQPRYVGLIPARAGSRRVPDKNVRTLGGRPLIEWSIAAGFDSVLDRVVVSTDSDRIAEVSRSAGAEVPFLRPAELATDVATTETVVLHFLQWLQSCGDGSTHVVVLQPTSPFRTGGDIDAAIERRNELGADAIVSVCPADCPSAWIGELPEDGRMTDFFRAGVRGVRSQDRVPEFRLNGAIYIYDIARALRQGSLEMDDATYAYVMPRERSIDIDEEIDFDVASALLARTDG